MYIRSDIENIAVSALLQVYLHMLISAQKCINSQESLSNIFVNNVHLVYENLNKKKSFLNFTLQARKWNIIVPNGTLCAELGSAS